MKKAILLFIFQLCSLAMFAQINTDRVLTIGRNALYFGTMFFRYNISIRLSNQNLGWPNHISTVLWQKSIWMIIKELKKTVRFCLERNPFLVQAYYARGIARQSQEKFDEAIEDYRKGLEFKAEDRPDVGECGSSQYSEKDLRRPKKVFDELMTAHPKYSMNYLTRGAMYARKAIRSKHLPTMIRRSVWTPTMLPLMATGRSCITR